MTFDREVIEFLEQSPRTSRVSVLNFGSCRFFLAIGNDRLVDRRCKRAIVTEATENMRPRRVVHSTASVGATRCAKTHRAVIITVV
ncbi:hypothetical protein C8N44_13020 [Allosediminivita pacifica]|uniref:Uncharacterized protein n=1 Tax=Allosediminivita pacifica TaxID=1267769 RepID=A0A2T6ABS9_9RHOB|nr:hypothetical protein C8N44_13020 [Allosediminivita pacifica]